MINTRLIKWLLLSCLLFALPLTAEEAVTEEVTSDEQVVTVDALVLYSAGASELYNKEPITRIEHLIEVSNEAFTNSELKVSIDAVDIREFSFSDEATPSAILAAALQDEEIKDLRNEVGADIVLIYRPYILGQGCGSAFVAGEENREHLAFAHIAIDCSASSTPHEVGHLLGLGHSHRQGNTGVTEYAKGHGVDSVFTTIMAYPSSFANAPRLLTFSSPELSCLGLPCGVPIDQDEPAHAVWAIKNTAHVVAAYRDEVTEPAVTPDAVTPQTPLEIAKASYEDFIPVYESAQQEFATLREELFAAYSETTTAFIAYIRARRDLLVLEQTNDSSSEAISAAESAVSEHRQNYKDSVARRNLALNSYITGFYEVLVPAIRTLASLRLTYEEELAKVASPPAESE